MSRRHNDALQSVADAIGRAFLAGEWEPTSMAERAKIALEDERKWLDRVAHMVVRCFKDRPADSHRSLAELVRSSPDLIERRRKDAAKDRPIWTVTAPLVLSQMAKRRWDVVPLDSVADVAVLFGLHPTHLAWYADVRSLERSAREEPLRHYTYRWIPKPTGGARLIEAPKPMLRLFQRRILQEILDPIPAHDAAHGFRHGRSIHTFVEPHVGRETVVRVDLESFFPSIRASRVFGIFRMAGYPEAVAHTLTGMVTNAVPDHVLWAGAVRHDRDHGRSRMDDRPYFRTPHLPQGAPTSPCLANLAGYRLDRRLAGLAESMGIAYTRYADDLAFSGDRDLARSAHRFVDLVSAISIEEGFRLNPRKTRVRRASERQHLGGLVVNKRPSVARSDYDLLKAIIHDAVAHGPAHANRNNHGDFKAHLLGRIGWIDASNPARGEKLRRMCDQISW